MAEFVYNNHYHPSIDTTPFFANLGYHPTLTNVPTTAQSDNSNERIQQIHKAQEECKRAIEQSQDISKRAYNKWKRNNPGFQVGDSVWLEATNLATNEPSPKLMSKCHGLFRIKDKLLDLTYRLELPAQWKIHDVFHVNVLSEARPDMIPNCTNPTLPPVKVNDEDLRSTWMPDGSAIAFSSRSNGKASRRSTTLGRMLKRSIPTPDLTSYRTEMMISTSRRTSIADIQMPPDELTLLPLARDQPDDGGFADSQ